MRDVFVGRRYGGTDITLHNLNLIGSGGDGRGYDQQYKQGHEDSLFWYDTKQPTSGAAPVAHPLTADLTRGRALTILIRLWCVV
jgi:hypothetical protein